MPTDNSPRTYIYLSRRLLRDLYDQHEAERRRRRLSAEVRAPGFALRSEGREDPTDNPFWLAKQATEAVSDHTGTLMDPGRYVRTKLFLTWSQVPFREDSYKVAWMWAIERPETGPVFVALCGSLRNYLAYDSYDHQTADGWFPSSADGLRYLVRCFAHAKDDPYSAAQRPQEITVPRLLGTAYAITDVLGIGHQIGQAEMEVLFEVFEYADDITLGSVRYRRALIGTPLWVATMPPRPFAHRPVYEPILEAGDFVDSPSSPSWRLPPRKGSSSGPRARLRWRRARGADR